MYPSRLRVIVRDPDCALVVTVLQLELARSGLMYPSRLIVRDPDCRPGRLVTARRCSNLNLNVAHGAAQETERPEVSPHPESDSPCPSQLDGTQHEEVARQGPVSRGVSAVEARGVEAVR